MSVCCILEISHCYKDTLISKMTKHIMNQQDTWCNDTFKTPNQDQNNTNTTCASSHRATISVDKFMEELSLNHFSLDFLLSLWSTY